MNAHISRTWINQLLEGWNGHDVDSLIGLYAPDFVARDVGQGQTYKGADGLRQLLDRYFSAFPDLRFEMERTIIENDSVALSWVARGTHQGKIMNIPPTGRQIAVHGVSMLTIESGKIKEATFIWDVAGLLRDLGLLPDL
jgi:steroid delta-isomerase-like uncharacterized protein